MLGEIKCYPTNPGKWQGDLPPMVIIFGERERLAARNDTHRYGAVGAFMCLLNKEHGQ